MRIWTRLTAIILAVALVATGPAFATLSVHVNPDGLISISLAHVQVGAQAGDEIRPMEQGLAVGEVIEKRTRTSKTEYLGDGRYALDISIGAIHYGGEGNWQPIQNEIVNDQMKEDDYSFTILQKTFDAGQVVEFASQGEYIRFQPMELQWTNSLDQIQSISMPQQVVGVVTNEPAPILSNPDNKTGIISWDNAYGTGRDFEWRTSPNRLSKILTVDAPLPDPQQYIIDGGDPVLRLSFILEPSPELGIYVDGELWDESTEVQTFNAIEFRKEGETVWVFAPARYWDTELGEGEVAYTWQNPNAASGTGWSNTGNAIDGNTGTYASATVGKDAWSSYLETTFTEDVSTDRLRVFSSAQSSAAETIQVRAYYDGVWNEVYNGSFVSGQWAEYAIAAGTKDVGGIQVRYYSTQANRWVRCHSIQAQVEDADYVWGVQTGVTTLRRIEKQGEDDQLWVDVRTPYGWLRDADYPVFIDPTLDLQVGANLDDVQEWEDTGGIVDSSYINHKSNADNALRSWAGHRWVSASLPLKGATITVAYVQLYGWHLSTDDMNGNLHFEKAASPAQFSTTAFDVTGRSRTTASTSWVADSLGVGFTQSPSLVTPLQEVVDAYDTTAIVVIFRPNTNVAKNYISYGYNQGSAYGAKLHIEYSDPVTTPEISSSAATNINHNSARLSYNLTDDGGADTTVKVYWGKTDGAGNSTAWDHNHSLGVKAEGTGYYDVGSLDEDTTYYFRYFAENSAGEDWSITRSFKTLKEVDITSTPDSYDFGTLEVNTTAVTGLDYFTITNTGGVAVDITIQGTDLTGGDDTWTLNDEATPGENTYGLKAGLDGGDYTVIVKKSATYNTLKTNLAASATQKWGLKIWMPTSVTGYDGQTMTGTVTLVASATS